jgi:hypothetical protein
MPPVEFELAILASERPKTHVLDRAATGIGSVGILAYKIPVVNNIYTYLLYVRKYILMKNSSSGT